MKKLFLLSLALTLFAQTKEELIASLQKVIDIYTKRLTCLEKNEANFCIQKYPDIPQSDALAKTFAMSFPKSFYEAKLKRDMKLLEEEKLCIGRSLELKDVQKCRQFR